MKYYFPDSQDQVDPSFDFDSETRSLTRVRQRDEHYAHEAIHSKLYDGMLVSKGIVDGLSGSSGRYTFAQRHRLMREGAHRFFRLPKGAEIIGDCGAFTYVNEYDPPYTIDEVVSFYDGCGFDYGISIDHVILGYANPAGALPGMEPEVPPDWPRRRNLTMELAEAFWERRKALGCAFEPVGAAQGWSPQSYADSVADLQRIGYTRVALGGMVPLKTDEILACLAAISDVRRPETQLHLLGVTRCEHVSEFWNLGVTSFDSTTPFRQAFKDDKDNYWTSERAYSAIRVPQVDGNARLKRNIVAGKVDQSRAIKCERNALEALRSFGSDDASMANALDAVDEYDALLGTKSRRSAYAETLSAAPWRKCSCDICRAVGIDVIIFRGTERNKRRGFHNLFAFAERRAAIERARLAGGRK